MTYSIRMLFINSITSSKKPKKPKTPSNKFEQEDLADAFGDVEARDLRVKIVRVNENTKSRLSDSIESDRIWGATFELSDDLLDSSVILIDENDVEYFFDKIVSPVMDS